MSKALTVAKTSNPLKCYVPYLQVKLIVSGANVLIKDYGETTTYDTLVGTDIPSVLRSLGIDAGSQFTYS